MQFKKLSIVITILACSLVKSSPIKSEKINEIGIPHEIHHIKPHEIHHVKPHGIAFNKYNKNKFSLKSSESDSSDEETVVEDIGAPIEVVNDSDIEEVSEKIDIPKEDIIEKVIPTDKFQKLTEDFSITEFRGDYGLDILLANGGADDDMKAVGFILSYLGYDFNQMIEFNAKDMACSALHVPKEKGNGYYFGRDFDWNVCNGLVLVNYPENGYSSISTVNTDFIYRVVPISLPDDILKAISIIAPLDGINEKGLSITVNIVEYNDTINQNDPQKGYLTTLSMVRVILDKADSVDKALEILNSYNLIGSFGFNTHYQIADNSGRSVVVEYLKNKMYVTETPVITNYYLSPDIEVGRNPGKNETTYEYLEKNNEDELHRILAENHESIDNLKTKIAYDNRYDVLNQHLTDHPTMNLTEVRDAMKSVSKNNYDEGNFGTEWTVIYDQENMEATYYRRLNYKHGFQIKLDTNKADIPAER